MRCHHDGRILAGHQSWYMLSLMARPMTPPEHYSWSEVVEKAMDALKMNEREFAAHLEVEVSTVSRWLNGHSQPMRAHGRQLLRHAGLTPSSAAA